MATSTIKSNLAQTIDFSGIQTAESWFSVSSWRGFKKNNVVHLFGMIEFNNSTGSAWGNNSGHTKMLTNLPFNAYSSRLYCLAPGDSFDTSTNGLSILTIAGGDLYLSFNKIKAGTSGTIMLETEFMVS